MMFHILRAIKNLSQRLVNIKSIVILIEGGNLTILNWFEESARKLNILGKFYSFIKQLQISNNVLPL